MKTNIAKAVVLTSTEITIAGVLQVGAERLIERVAPNFSRIEDDLNKRDRLIKIATIGGTTLVIGIGAAIVADAVSGYLEDTFWNENSEE